MASEVDIRSQAGPIRVDFDDEISKAEVKVSLVAA